MAEAEREDAVAPLLVLHLGDERRHRPRWGGNRLTIRQFHRSRHHRPGLAGGGVDAQAEQLPPCAPASMWGYLLKVMMASA